MKPVITDDYAENLRFIENEDGTYSLNFKQLPALLFVSYDGNGTYDQLFLHGKYKPEIRAVKIESEVEELTTYTVEGYAAVKLEEAE